MQVHFDPFGFTPGLGCDVIPVGGRPPYHYELEEPIPPGASLTLIPPNGAVVDVPPNSPSGTTVKVKVTDSSNPAEQASAVNHVR